MSIFKKREIVRVEKETAIIMMPIAPDLVRVDLQKLVGLTLEDPTLRAILRILTDLHGACMESAEQAVRVADSPHASAVAVARASGVAAAIDAIVAATRGRLGRHGHQETGFGAEEQ